MAFHKNDEFVKATFISIWLKLWAIYKLKTSKPIVIVLFTLQSVRIIIINTCKMFVQYNEVST